MRKLIAGFAVVATIAILSGCTTVPSEQTVSAELAAARQNVKIYDVMPPNSTPIEQVTATECDGTREAATDKLLVLTSQRGGNGLAQLACKSEGFSFSFTCMSSSTCTGAAIKVVQPPPPPPPKKLVKPKPKRA
jgi:hypothetical protein